MKIRTASPADAPVIAEIYAPIVRETAISFESEPPDAAVMAGRIEKTLATHPWLVAVEDEAILGYAYASQFRARAAYRWSCEVTAYVAANTRRGGVGRALYDLLLACLRRQNFRAAFAVITIPNDASIGFHKSFGFQEVGVLQEVGFKFGTWHDVAYLRLGLSDLGNSPPEPTPFSILTRHGR